jgi:hypothetical protein
LWLAHNDESVKPEALPIFICEMADKRQFYGLPNIGGGFKISLHCEGQLYTKPEDIDRSDDEALIAEALEVIKKHMRVPKEVKI